MPGLLISLALIMAGVGLIEWSLLAVGRMRAELLGIAATGLGGVGLGVVFGTCLYRMVS